MAYTHTQSQRGYSMVEVLVAIAVLLLATVGPMTIAARSLQYAQFTSEQNTAFFLAQEGIEAFYKVRGNQGLLHLTDSATHDSWGWQDVATYADCRTDLSGAGCGIDWTDADIGNNVIDCADPTDCRIHYDETASRARFSYDTAGTETPYTRIIAIEEVSGTDAVLVRSTVSWEASGSRENREVILETYLHDIYDTEG